MNFSMHHWGAYHNNAPLDCTAINVCSDPACDCDRLMEEFFKVNEAIPRLKTSRDYPIASKSPNVPPDTTFAPGSAVAAAKRGPRKRYPCRNPAKKLFANIGQQHDPCPISLVQHPKDWDPDTTINTERDPNLFRQNKKKVLKNVKMI